MKPIGKISHYYGKIGVAIVELEEELKVGDRIQIEDKGATFEQSVASLQKDHQAVSQAGKGDVVGLKVDGKVQEGALVLLLDQGE